MAPGSSPLDDMTILINAINKNIYTLSHGSRQLDQAGTGRRSMYPDHNHNPFIVGNDEHEYVEEIVSPLSPARRKSAWHPDSWSPDRFPRAASFDNEAYGHSTSPYAAENVEEPANSVHFNRVDWENQQRHEHNQHIEQDPRSTISSAEEFRLSKSRDTDDGLGIHITDSEQEFRNEKASWEPTQPPPSAYRPNTRDDFEDVELNKPHQKPGSSLTKSKKRACNERNFRILLWALVLILPFVVLPLAIFGGVYHWGNAQGLCKAGGGAWNGTTNSCQY